MSVIYLALCKFGMESLSACCAYMHVISCKIEYD